MTLGAYLKSEREARGITLEKISRETRLGIRMLEAIESDRLELLPDGMFRNAFIKTFARQIGLDGDRVLRDFHLLASQPPAAPAPEKNWIQTSDIKSRMNAPLSIGLGAVVVVGLIAYLILRQDYGRKPVEVNRETPSHASKPASATPPPTAVPTAQPSSGPQGGVGGESVKPAEGNAGAQPGAPAPGSPLQSRLKVLGELAQKNEVPGSSTTSPGILPSAEGLDLHLIAKEKTWISVMSGDTTIFTGLLEVGNSKDFSLNHPLKITLGNAGGALLSVHGRNFRPLGVSGEVRVILVTAENVEQYLASQQP